MKLYIQEVSHCLNCPNFIQYKQGQFLERGDPMACKAMNYKELTWDILSTKDESRFFPDWCPLKDKGGQ